MGTIAGILDTAGVIDCAHRDNREREIETLVARYWPALYRIAFRYLGNTADAEDAVQDALLSAYKHVGQFRGQARLSTWVTAIVVNSARMHLRRRPSRLHVALDEHDPRQEGYAVSEVLPDRRPSPEDQCCELDLGGHVVQLAQELSPKLRTAFQLRYLTGLTIREMTAVLGIPESTVKAQIARARSKLRRLIRKRLGVATLARSLRHCASSDAVRETNASERCHRI